jgi:hypothetical protein
MAFKMKGWSPFTKVPTYDKHTGLYIRPDTSDKYSEENIAKRKAERAQRKEERQAKRDARRTERKTRRQERRGETNSPFDKEGSNDKIKIARAKRLVRKYVGDQTVDSPTFSEHLSEEDFDRAVEKMIKADMLLQKAGYSLEEREDATGASGYDTAMGWAKKRKAKLKTTKRKK